MTSTPDRLALVVGGLLTAAAAIVAFRDVSPIRTAIDDWRRGRRDAQVLQAEWSAIASLRPVITGHETSASAVLLFDYRCPFCRMLFDSLRAYPRNASIALAFVHNPRDAASRIAATDALCAYLNGRFAEQHDVLLTRHRATAGEQTDSAVPVQSMPSPGESPSCSDRDSVARLLSRDSLLAAKFSLRATPVLLRKTGSIHVGLSAIMQELRRTSSRDSAPR
jgi:protein-disulfide isomerase